MNLTLQYLILLFTVICTKVHAQRCPNNHNCYSNYCTWYQDGSYKCLHDCKDGYWRDDCRSGCIDTNCQLCSKIDGTCYICRDGYFVSITASRTCTACADGRYGTQCSLLCSVRCDNVCNKSDGICSCKPNYTGNKCETCYTGKYGSLCDKECSRGCVNQCNIDTGSCTCKPYFTGTLCESCINGWYGTECTQQCENNCVSCHNLSSCISCKSGFYGNICQNQCLSTCESCMTSVDCTTCKSGYYGSYCQSSCSAGCANTHCDKHTASCYSCTNGYAGHNCFDKCSTGCKHDTCQQNSGNCAHGCKDGFYGFKCEHRCPSTCITCNSSQQCGICVSGRYGSLCEKYCPDTCEKCDDTGKCTSCKEGFSDIYLQCRCSIGLCASSFSCQFCTNSTYYTNGYTCCPCSSSCKYSLCSSAVQCTRGCEDGFYGTGCDFPCTNINTKCAACSGDMLHHCTRCIVGYHPNENGACIPCSANCVNRKCNSSTGNCENRCHTGFWNSNCDMKCKENCSVCNQDNGECLKCSFPYMYGKECEIPCSSKCINKSCHINGTCINGCILNYFGSSCDTPCSSNCEHNGNESRCSRETGLCINGCSAGFTGAMCMEGLKQGSIVDSVSAAAIGGGIAALVIVGIVIAFGLFIYLRRRNRKPKPKLVNEQSSNEDNPSAPVYATVVRSGKQDNTGIVYVNTSSVEVDIATPPDPVYTNDARHLTMKIVTTEDSLEIDELDNIARQNAIRFEENGGVYYNNDTEVKKFKIPVAELQKFVKSKNRDYFNTEFEKLPYGLLKDYNVSQMKANIAKNRYKGIYPYDDHRVKVLGGDTDYINASFIDGFKRRKEYIATLGPMSKQLGDFSAFWRMVWQQKVEKIVVVTNLVEGGTDKCEQYWPNEGSSRMFGDVRVLCQSENPHAAFTRRTLTIEKDKDERTLNHLHFTAWPDKDIPDDVTSIIEFRQNVLDAPSTLGGPTIVHCSAGIGRTGTYIAIDILINEGKSEGTVDIAGCVLNMRQNRPNMVQTAGQYEYLHRAVVHALTSDRKPE